MNWLNKLFPRFGSKLLFSYLLIILIAFAILAIVVDLAIPPALSFHMGNMDVSMGMMNGAMGSNGAVVQNTRAAVNDALFWAAAVAILIAIALSVWLARQVVSPVHEMMLASRQIAEGRYDRRVKTTGDGNSPDELTQLALSFNQMAAQLEHAEKLRRELIADVSHELRTPLTAVKGYAEGLLDDVLPANHETYEQIRKQAERIQRLVADLQELSFVEAEEFAIQIRLTSLTGLEESLHKLIGRQFKEKGVRLEFDVEAGLPKIWADEDRLNQVLVNLLNNALQYTPSGGVVRVSATRANGEVRVDVSDTGVGIAAEHLSRIFDRFYRADKSRSREGGGSGIGLTIAKRLVEAHGGHIWANSGGLGKGSTFSLTLPIKPEN